MSLITINVKAYNDAKLEQLISLAQSIGGNMATQAELDTAVAQIRKGIGEVIAKIAELQAQNPALDLTELLAVAQQLDDIVPDAPVV